MANMRGLAAGIAAALLFAVPAFAQNGDVLVFRHALTLYGEPKYKAGFAHFDYVNPKAPVGGEVKLAETGTFDSLNPFIIKGVKAPGIQSIFETLMTPSLDEPQSFYPLIAQSVAVDSQNRFVEFILNPRAKWHDGTPVTADDVVFSLETLRNKGDPTYKILFADISKAEKIGTDHVRFSFTAPDNRELPTIIAANLPILSKAYYATHDFERTTLETPLTSGAYKVEAVDPGRAIAYRRVAGYWGANLPVNIGQNNFETIRYDMYRDENVALEAFKAGACDFRQEYIARNWATAYDNPALREGRIIKTALVDGRPQGMQGFAFNQRRSKLKDRRVREAIGLSMDFEWLNKSIFYGAYKRNTSYFLNTDFAATGTPQGEELALLQPYAGSLPAALFTQPFAVPATDGSGNVRANLLRAQGLLEEAGYIIKDGVRVDGKTGEPLEVEFMIRQATMERVAMPMRKNMERLGIKASIRMVDDSQYQKRIDEGDFDIISVWLNRGVFFPGNEQMALWHSSQADVKGSANTAGLKNKTVDALLAKLVAAKSLEELTPPARALDRVLLWEHVVIPHWYSGTFRIAYWNKFGHPETQPPYNNGFQAWWVKPAGNEQ